MAAVAVRLLAAGRDHVRACPARWSAASARLRSLATAGRDRVRAGRAEACDRVAVGHHRSRVFAARVREEASEMAALVDYGKQEAGRSALLLIYGRTAPPAMVWRGGAQTAWEGAKLASWRVQPGGFSVQMLITQELIGSVVSLGRELPIIVVALSPFVYPLVSSAVMKMLEASDRQDPAELDARVAELLMEL